MRYNITATREDRWWMISVPPIDGLTQARRLSDIEPMARSLIAVTADLPASHVELGETRITVPGLGDVTEYTAEVAQARAQAEAAETEAANMMQEKAHRLVAAQVAVTGCRRNARGVISTQASHEMRDAARQLRNNGYSVTDTATLLRVSRGRISQLP